jgi:toxin ParE1/3/4
MAKATWSSVAERDLESIVEYITLDGRPLVAEQIAREIRVQCQFHAEHPTLGERETRIGGSCRRFVYKRWVVIYRIETDGIGVIRVVDGARDFDRLF